MRGEQGNQNKILPVKSLFENARQLGKKQYIQFGPRDTPPLPLDPAHTPRTHPTPPPPQRPPHTHRDPPAALTQIPPREHFKGISLGKNQQISKQTPCQFPKQSVQLPLPQFQELNPTKRERSVFSEYDSSLKLMGYLGEGNPMEGIKGTRRSDTFNYEEGTNARTVATEKKESLKSIGFNRLSEELESKSTKFNEKYSSKMEDQTWNVSNFERMTQQDRANGNEQLARMKMELMQKEAQLADKTLLLEERETQVKELTVRLELTVDLNVNLKSKIVEIKKKGEEIRAILNEKETENREYEEKGRILQETLKAKEEELIKLKTTISRCKDENKTAEEDLMANHKLALLKIRQLEFEDREKTQTVLELREKEKRTADNYEKIINGINELLRQKEEHLIQISETAMMYKEEVGRINLLLEGEKIKHANDVNGKEVIIRELSAEIGDLKRSLNAYEARVREMIEVEDELKKELQYKIVEDNAIIGLKDEYNIKLVVYEAERAKSSQQVEFLMSKISQLESNIIELKNSETTLKVQCGRLQGDVASHQQTIKLLSQQNRDLLNKVQSGLEDLQHKQTFFRLAQDKINELEFSASEREKQLNGYIIRCQQLQEVNRVGSFTRIDSPTKSSRDKEDKEVAKLKSTNLKLLKDNERLSLIIKDMDAKLYQFYKVNKGLNDEIIKKQLQAINAKIMLKSADCQQ